MKIHSGTFILSVWALIAPAFFFAIGSAESAVWVTNGTMSSARRDHTATLLLNGKVMVTGGTTAAPGVGGPLSSTTELYDPSTGKWTITGSLNVLRVYHTATLLRNGKVLVVGGQGTNSVLSSAELYDPVTGTWTPTGAMNMVRWVATATLLPDGKVLVAGGIGNAKAVHPSAELYDPITGLWTTTNPLGTAREGHTATLLANGLVLVAGGYGITSLSSAELFNPLTGTWSAASPLTTAHWGHTATLLPNGNVLIAAGSHGGNSAELFNPVSGVWTATGTLTASRNSHAASLLPDGKVLVTGGANSTNGYLSSTEVYDPATGIWTATNSMNGGRGIHTSTLLANGRVLITGGSSSNYTVFASTELYDSSNGAWTSTGLRNTTRSSHSATLLPNGNVLLAGGMGNNGATTNGVELYNAISGTWIKTNSMSTARREHTATLLPDGKVLVAGGRIDVSNATQQAELFNPANGVWTTSGTMASARYHHTATLLRNGKLLITGGRDHNVFLSSAEIYDPASGQWKTTSLMTTNRESHTATLLPNGKVLVAGGRSGSPTNFNTLVNAELFDPASETWLGTGAMITNRSDHSAVLLPNGKVMVSGGRNIYTVPGAPIGWANFTVTTNAELFDPVTAAWTSTGAMTIRRDSHTATLLPNGMVLVTGQLVSGASTELYDPTVGKWMMTGSLSVERASHTATLLLNGKVLLAGGRNPTNSTVALLSSELYDSGLGFSNSWRPQIATNIASLNLGSALVLTGSGFGGVSGASSGNTQDSSSDYPLVQLRALESGQTTFLQSTNWSTNSFASAPVWNFPPGYALATMFVSGIPSTSSIVNISVPIPTSATIINPQKLANGFQFTFTNTPGAVFGAWMTTNLSLPFTNWTALGGITEISSGQFKFVDSQPTNFPKRFYTVRLP